MKKTATSKSPQTPSMEGILKYADAYDLETLRSANLIPANVPSAGDPEAQ